VFLLALAVRAAYLGQMAGADLFGVLFGDGAVYHEWAQRIAGGDWLGDDVFYQAPLYPYLLGAIYAVQGVDPGAVRVVQIFLGATACLFLCQAGRHFFSPTIGAVAGAMLALYPTAIFFDGLVQKSSLDLFLTTGLLWVLGSLLARPGVRGWALAGVVLGALALTRENALALAPVLLAWLWFGFRAAAVRSRLQWTAALSAGLAVVLVPVGARNAAVGGEFHLTTAQFGPNFFIGNHAAATGGYVSLRAGRGRAEYERLDATELAQEAVGRALRPAEVSRFWTGQAFDWIAAHPADWLRLTVWKWSLVWNAVDVTDTDDPLTYGEYSSLLAFLNGMFHFGVLGPLAALGLWLTWGERRRLWLLYAMLLIFALSVTLFFVVARYRHPLVPLLVLFAAAGVVRGVTMARGGRWREVAVGAALAVAAAVIVNWPLVDADSQRAPTRYNLGVELAARGDLEAARHHFTAATHLDPNLGVAWGNLGNVLAMRGQNVEAERHFREALRREPGLLDARFNLGVLLLSAGRGAEASDQFREAVRRRPRWPEAHRGLGQALAATGRLDEAVGSFEASARLAPDQAGTEYDLGTTLARQGRRSEALLHLRRARELAEPTHDEAFLGDIRAAMAALGDAGDPAGAP
jgi:Tfp pilus assembly protein PilF